ncbi:ABC transporter permease [Massilia sp. DJPM01]|uniref:ABC transporter permease n=1 Tax=Massilia sp. DJPM01 TaxID=3024404 RepID=UPI00259F5457|nr:ABC transporter permease [Massilia sp. DJPM01]MDM5176736.1 ABC transporter permease [Massilia sp. DJPM01]
MNSSAPARQHGAGDIPHWVFLIGRLMLSYILKVVRHNTQRNRVLTALMVLAIAVGIGASMTTLTVMRLLSGDPLPGRSQHIYYAQIDVNPQSKGKEPPDVLDYQTAVDLWKAGQADQQVLVAGSKAKVRPADGSLPAQMLSLRATTADFFSMFDVPFHFGQAWSAADDTGRTRVAVISASLNEKLFGGANSVGKVIRVANADVKIVGVLAAWRPAPLFYAVRGGRFSGGDTSSFYRQPDDVFMPFFTSLEVNGGNFQPFNCWAKRDQLENLERAPCTWIGLWVRLDDPAKVAAYKRFLDNSAAQLKQQGRVKYAENTRLRTLGEWLDFNLVVPADVKLQTVLAFAFLAICLINVVALLLAKFLRHSPEIGLRRALGATRGAIFAQCLAEAACIGLLGGVTGLLLTLFGLYLVRQQPVSYVDLAYLDVPMFCMTFALSVAVSLLAGIIPALRATLIQPAVQLNQL